LLIDSLLIRFVSMLLQRNKD